MKKKNTELKVKYKLFDKLLVLLLEIPLAFIYVLVMQGFIKQTVYLALDNEKYDDTLYTITVIFITLTIAIILSKSSFEMMNKNNDSCS